MKLWHEEVLIEDRLQHYLRLNQLLGLPGLVSSIRSVMREIFY